MARKSSSSSATPSAPVAPAVNETTQATAATATVDAPAPSTLATDGTVQAPAPTVAEKSSEVIEAEKKEAARIARIDALYVSFAKEVGTRENKFAPLAKLSQADAWEMLAKWSRYVNAERMDKPDFSKLAGCTTPDDATESQKKGAKVARALALQTVQDFNKPTLGLFRLSTDARASRFAGESTEKRTERVLKSGKVIIGQNIRTAYEVPSACGYAFTTRG